MFVVRCSLGRLRYDDRPTALLVTHAMRRAERLSGRNRPVVLDTAR